MFQELANRSQFVILSDPVLNVVFNRYDIGFSLINNDWILWKELFDNKADIGKHGCTLEKYHCNKKIILSKCYDILLS